MKYKDYPILKAREHCKKYAYKKYEGKYILCHCEKCELRRTRTDEKGREITLMCYWRLQDLLSELAEDYEELRNEEIKYLKEN